MKKFLFPLLAIALIVSCAKPMQEEPIVDPIEGQEPEQKASPTEIAWARNILLQPQSTKILEQSNSFAFNFFKAVSKKQNQNLFLSPYSVSAVLGMLYNGANGKTKDEIAKILGMSDYTPEEVNQYYRELTKALLEVDPSSSLSFANAVWVNKGISIKGSFAEINKTYYDAEANTLDFTQSSAIQTVNDWCKEKTKGTIPKILESIDPSTLAILANAIYFKSFWTHDFDKSKTVEKPFHNINGTTSRISMMHQKQMDLNYVQMDRCGMLICPYANTAFAMNLILPVEGEDLDTLIEDLDASTWQVMMTHYSSAKVTFSMPRFKIESDLQELKDILAAMGMPSAFSDDADFSAMFEGVQTYISQVIQKSYISVDEDGTEASAVTLAHMQGSVIDPLPTPPTVEMILDRPFIFAITEKSTGAILFMGKVTSL